MENGPSKTDPGASSRSAHTLRRFWDRITEGYKLNQLWSQFRSDVQSSYGLYSAEINWTVPEKTSWWKRNFELFKAFAWAIIIKLSPARRVLLLLAVVLLLVPFRIEYAEGSFRSRDSHILGGLILLVLLILEIADRVTMKRDLEIARDIQRWLMPGSAPQIPGVDLAFTTRPANTVAGDYYDVLLRPSRADEDAQSKLLVCVADVVGKSMPAALLMATFQAGLRTLSLTPCTLEELVSGLNRYACDHSGGGLRFTTAFLGELDLVTGQFCYINAGHNPPILKHQSRPMERLEKGGLPFGIRHQATYDRGKTTLFPGDLLAVFTDGVVEAVNDLGQEYQESRLLAVLTARPVEDAAGTLASVMADLNAFVGSARQHDDITLLVLRRL